MSKLSDNEEALRQCCNELKLPSDLTEWFLSHVVPRLRKVEGFKSKTVPMRRAELEQVASLARQLNSLTQGLDLNDRDRIEREFAVSPLRLTLDPPNPLEAVFKDMLQPNILRIGDVLLTLAGIADVQRKVLVGGSQGGRPSVLSLYAWDVALVARMVHPLGIAPGRGGDFEVLCEAIFEVADVPAKPDNAIRFFMKYLYKEMLVDWLQDQEVETTDREGQ